jgi:hypothetical protein
VVRKGSRKEGLVAKRKPERSPEGRPPADSNAPLDPVALWERLRTSPLTAAQARALVVDANARARRAAVARDAHHGALMEAMARGDWTDAGELFAAQQREDLARAVRPRSSSGAASSARTRPVANRAGRSTRSMPCCS